jgi:hypothetical protein
MLSSCAVVGLTSPTAVHAAVGPKVRLRKVLVNFPGPAPANPNATIATVGITCSKGSATPATVNFSYNDAQNGTFKDVALPGSGTCTATETTVPAGATVSYSCTTETGSVSCGPGDSQLTMSSSTAGSAFLFISDDYGGPPPPIHNFVMSPTSGPVGTVVSANQGSNPCEHGVTQATLFVNNGEPADGNPLVFVAPFHVPVDSSGKWHAQVTIPSSAVAGPRVFVNANCDGQPDPYEGQEFHISAASPSQATILTRGGPVTVKTSSGTITKVTSTNVTSPPPGCGCYFPWGLIGFTVTGLSPRQTITITIVLPFGPVAGKYKFRNGTWYQMPGSLTFNTVSYSITEGGFFDADNSANGTLIDPIGVSTAFLPGSPSFTG